MATYRQGPYRVEEGYAMIDQDGEKAHQETFAETAGQASELLRRAVGFDRFDTEIEVWSPGPVVGGGHQRRLQDPLSHDDPAVAGLG